MKVAVEGCCHGELDEIYASIADLERRNSYKVDLLLICGDFQAVRNYNDLQCMAVPHRYKKLQGFYQYYSGKKKAPMLTICIGGNHEASNYFQELYHGGWIAPNIYFMGQAGCVNVNGLRIAGASGIYKQHDFRKGQDERLPYTPAHIRSIYHIREYNVRRLSLLTSRPDVFLSHDWPLGIEQYGDLKGLLRRKQYFGPDIQKGTLGSPPLMGLLRTLKPKHWFAAHLHVKFEAVVLHGPLSTNATSAPVTIGNPDEIIIDEDAGVGETEAVRKDNPDEIALDDEEFDVAPVPSAPSPAVPQEETKFLALDKCLPRRQGFLEVVDIPLPIPRASPDEPLSLKFDSEWLAITRAFHPLLTTKPSPQGPFPPEQQAREMVAQARKHFTEGVEVSSIQKFSITAPPAKGEETDVKFETMPQPPWYPNEQTAAFCHMVGIDNNIGV